MRLGVAAAVIVSLLAGAGTAAAQGRGRGVGNAPPAGPTRGGNQTSTTPVVLQPSSFFPQYGTWLDDATTADPGAGYASLGMGYWRGSNATQLNAPILGVTYGLANRTQLSATVPFYRVSYEGYTASGLDNVYISGKFAIVDPNAGAGRFGIALGAAAEILSAGFTETSRLHWAVPLSIEFRTDAVRVYGSTGYFSRGAVFAAGALEWTMPGGTSLTASLAHTASIDHVRGATTTAAPRASLREASLLLSHPVSTMASVYVAGSRAFSRTSIDGASSVTGGLSFRFASPRGRPTD